MSSRTALALTEGYQRAREEAVGCWGASGAAAVKNGRLVASLRTAMATAERGGARLLLRRGREAGKCEMRARDGSGGHWRG